MASLPNYDEFKKALNQTVQVKSDNDAQEMTLAEISDVKQSGGFSSFSVVLCGSKATPLPQNNYQVSSDALGEMSILMVPIGAGKNGIEYQAVFSKKME